MFPNIPSGQIISLDYETSGLKYWEPDFQVFGVAIAIMDETMSKVDSWYFDVRHHPGLFLWLADLLPRCALVVAQFAQYEYQCTRVLKIDPRTIKFYCTMTAQCLINEHMLTYDLESIAFENGIDSKKSEHIENIRIAMGWKNKDEVMARFSEVPLELAAPYGADDVALALQVFYKQIPQIDEQELNQVVRLEMDLMPVLADMSWSGVRVDLEAAHVAIPLLDEQEVILQAEINELTGKNFNVNSTPQIRDFFKPEPISKFQWKLVDGTLVGPTKSGKGPSIDQNVLREIDHPVAKKIQALRKTIKLRDTFIRGHVIGSADGDGYVHTQFNQTRNDTDAGTITGRLSSTDPALQQITKRDKENARILRSLFLADDQEDWLCADYSQVDFRCSAHLINDPGVIAAYQADPSLDYHQIVSDMTGIPRNAPYAGAPYTKQINLGLAFGAGKGKLAFMMKMPYMIKEYKGKMAYIAGPEASAVFDLYHKKLPGVKKFMEHAENVAKTSHFVRTAVGRRLRYRRGIGAHRAAGHLYQAYAADLHKLGLVAVDRLIRDRGLPVRLMMSCHDEIGISMVPDQEIADLIRTTYTNFNSEDSVIRMRVPITASCKFGPNWFEASKD